MQKMKLAYFLRGLGVGMVFVTVVMAVSMKENKTIVQKEMTKEQIIQKAKEYGMTEGIGMKVDQIFDATQTSEPTQAPKEEAQEKPTEEILVEPGATKKFEVFSGQTAGEIAKELENQGLVEDAEQFHKFLDEEGYTTKLIAGKHNISINGSYEQIAKQLCEYNK